MTSTSLALVVILHNPWTPRRKVQPQPFFGAQSCKAPENPSFHPIPGWLGLTSDHRRKLDQPFADGVSHRTVYLICGVYYKSWMPRMMIARHVRREWQEGLANRIYYIDFFSSSQESPSEPNLTAIHPPHVWDQLCGYSGMPCSLRGSLRA